MTPPGQFRIELWRPDAAQLATDLEMMGEVLHACVQAGASVGFVLPFSRADAMAYWRGSIWPGVHSGQCRTFVARDAERVVGPAERIVGTVVLDLAGLPNQAHRADVRKLLVHPKARRRGVARALMQALEDHARSLGRTLLTLDTRTGDAAEPLYRSMGYATVGVIPGFARRFDSDELDSTTVMYKEMS
jgi:GNAT superfamily N-acetyltransferase